MIEFFSAKMNKHQVNYYADTLSQYVEVVLADLTKLLGFETTQFSAEDYRELVQKVKNKLTGS